MKPKETQNLLLTVASGSQTVILLIGPVILCLLIGLWIDKTFHTSPWFLILGVLIGFSTSIWNIYKTIIKQSS